MELHIVVSCMLYLAVFQCTKGDGHMDHEEQEQNILRTCRPDLMSCLQDPLEWARLANKLDGKLAWPDNSMDYTDYNYQHNLRTFTFPLVHVVVKSAKDIQEAVKFATKPKHELRMTIKSSGHDYWGRSSAHSSFSINLMEMKDIVVNPQQTERSDFGEVKVGTGVTFNELYEELDKHNRVVVGGSGHKVATGGYFAGGGHSPISPSLGLGVDSVLEIQVVLADGRIATCTENKTDIVNHDGTKTIRNDGQLFWALRGGGGGTFGVVVYYVLKLHEAPESMVSVFITMPFRQDDTDVLVVESFFEKYNHWLLTAPSYWGGYAMLNNHLHTGEAPINATHSIPYKNTGTIMVILNKFGPWDDNTLAELEPFYELKDDLPDDFVNIMVGNATSLWNYLKSDPLYTEYVREYTMGTFVTPEKHNGTGLQKFFKKEFLEGNNGNVGCVFVRLGGKVMEYTESSASVHPGFRKAQSWLACSFSPALGDDVFGWDVANNKQGVKVFEEQHRQKQNASDFAARLREFGDGEYFNEGFAPNPNWKIDFWGPHYVDLLKVKINYDPHNYFSCYHCVGSDYGSFVKENKTSSSTTVSTTYSAMILLISMVLFM